LGCAQVSRVLGFGRGGAPPPPLVDLGAAQVSLVGFCVAKAPMIQIFVLLSSFWSSVTVTEPPLASVEIAPSGSVFSEWLSEAAETAADCRWWDGKTTYDSICSTFAVTRVGTATLAQATDRANRCAAQGTTGCVLNGEIGLALPALFLYDESAANMRMIIAPRLLAQESTVKTVKIVDPLGEAPNQLFDFNSTITIEYLKGGARTLATETLRGNDAYCVQALRRSVAATCWEALD